MSLPRRIQDAPQGHFANVHIPATHMRYESLCEWRKTADPKFWKFGKSSDGVDGIWVPLNIWSEGQAAIRTISAYTVPTPEVLRNHYARHGLAGEPKAKVWNETESDHEF